MFIAEVRLEALYGGLVLFFISHFFLQETDFAGEEVKALFFRRRRKTHCIEISCVSRETENTNPRAKNVKGEIKMKLQEIKKQRTRCN